jgi:hypothetical protein
VDHLARGVVELAQRLDQLAHALWRLHLAELGQIGARLTLKFRVDVGGSLRAIGRILADR